MGSRLLRLVRQSSCRGGHRGGHRRGRRVSRIAAAALVLSTSGCWLQLGADGGHTRFNPLERDITPANVADLRQVWSVALPGTLSEPIVSGDHVYVTRSLTQSASVRALALGTGATRWETTLVTGSGPDTIVGATPVAFVGNQLHSGHFGFAAVSPGGQVCELRSDVLDPVTGRLSGGADGFPSATASSGGVVARSVVRAGPTCAVTAPVLEVTVARPGEPLVAWSSTIAGPPSGDFVPTVTGEHVFLPHENTLDAWAAGGCGAATCAPIWSRAFPDFVGAAVAAARGGTLFVASGPVVAALDPATGRELWRVDLGVTGLGGGGLALAGGTLFVARPSGQGGELVALDAGGCGAAVCEPLWTAPLSGGLRSAPTVGGAVVYTATSSGVQAFAAAGCGAPTCAPLAEIPLEGGRLTVAEGHVLVARTGNLTALALDTDTG